MGYHERQRSTKRTFDPNCAKCIRIHKHSMEYAPWEQSNKGKLFFVNTVVRIKAAEETPLFVETVIESWNS